MLYIILLGLAVSLDAFAAGVAYGLKSIKMPVRSLAVIALITAVCTSVAMLLAYYLGSLLNTAIAVAGGSLLLIAIGGWNIFQEYITKKSKVPDSKTENTSLKFRLGRIVINIMADPETADIDKSSSISPSEAVLLGLALGVDNMIAVFAAALIKPLPLYTPVIMAFIQALLLAVGILAAAQIPSENLKRRFPYIPGTILIVLGLLRLV